MRFLLVGITAAGIDYTVYMLLLWAGMVVSVAKGVSFVAGAIFAFFANRDITFAAVGRKRAALRFGVLYLTSLVANVAVNRLMLAMVPGHIVSAFVVATALSAAMNFFGMKLFVFIVREERR